MTFDGETTICTVIVCPKSVISNWISQARDFVERDYLNIVVYDGTPANRSDIIRKVQQNKVDILLSTYETIAAEHNKERLDKSGRPLKGIHDIKFHRIVLDEAQQIRNHKSKTYIAIDSVAQNSVYRLAISGTPFVNKPEDVMSLLSFIGLQPLGDPAAFKEYVSDPIKERRRAGLTRLRLACAYVVLRRTKGIVSTGMADKTIHVHSIDFPSDSIHKQIYEALYCACRVAMSASLRHSSITVSASTHRAMFAMLMRVRQSCASGSLVQAAHYEVALHLMKSVYDEDGNVKELSQSEGNRMLDILQNAKSVDGSRVDVKGVSSPKINALMNTISQMQPDEKGVIFSQWTSMLDLIGNALASAGHRFTRIDGSMSTTERTCALNSLKNDDECRFILCSLKAAGVGINLTRYERPAFEEKIQKD
jgi:SNF2 family DNA or RNA helicase